MKSPALRNVGDFAFNGLFIVKKCLIMNESRMHQIILEELSKQEVKSMIDAKLDSYIKERDFKKEVRKITADVIEDFFKEMWRKNGFWKNSLKNG